MSDSQFDSIPGFVDLQVNGFQGVDFSRDGLSYASILSVAEALQSRGTAAWLATLVTCSPDVYRRNLPLIAQAIQDPSVNGRILGIHLEGPFISCEPGFVGAHDPQYVRLPDPAMLEQMQQWADGTIRLITIAAEVPGADELVYCARELGIVVSVGHSDYAETDLQRVVDAGATALTHLGNAVPNQLPRHHNAILDGLGNDGLIAMMITDGHHLPPSLIKTILRTKTPERCLVVSDVCPLAGLPPGEYEVFGSPVVLEPSGRISNPRRGCLAASGHTLAEAMRYLASLNLLNDSQLLDVGFQNPLHLLGIDSSRIS